MAILAAWKSRRALGCDFVFHDGGRSHSYAGLWSAWTRACRAAKVANLNLHDFRRAAYDECSAAGLDVHEAMELIGHRNIATAATEPRAARTASRTGQRRGAA